MEFCREEVKLMADRYVLYNGCPICTSPSNEVRGDYVVDCKMCKKDEKFYLTEDVINDWFVMKPYNSEDTYERLDRQMKENRKIMAVDFIKFSKSTSDDPITNKMIMDYIEKLKNTD
jgi:hypothetical protein